MKKLLANTGSQTFKLLFDLVAPKLSEKMSYGEVLDELTRFFKPMPVKISEQYHFYSICRQCVSLEISSHYAIGLFMDSKKL